MHGDVVVSAEQMADINRLLGVGAGAAAVRPDEHRPELDSYRHRARVEFSDNCNNPISLWDKTQYPILSALAEEYLSIPASSATVERLFSAAGSAGLVLEDLRLSTKDELTAALVFLRFNRRWFWPYKEGGEEKPPFLQVFKTLAASLGL